MSRALFVFAVLFGLVNIAQAEPARFGAFGGVGYSAYQDTNNNVGATGDPGTALGVSLEAGLSDNVGIESGVQFSDQRYQIPLVARFWIQDTITAAVGPYLG